MASLLGAVRNWVDHIHLNESSRSEREGRAVVVKRRRFGAGLVMKMANGFFRLARNPVEAIVDRREWQQWEVDCFVRLHGPDANAGADPSGTTWIEVLPGRSLSEALDEGTLTPQMVHAAGLELRRAHARRCPHYGSGWTHGDPHTGNFLYDPETCRAWLIDFEVRHRRDLREADRQADDVLVLLQDVCGRCPAHAWPGLASAILDGYGNRAVTERLAERLIVPNGVPRLWWAIRTTWMPRVELERRLAVLLVLLGAG